MQEKASNIYHLKMCYMQATSHFRQSTIVSKPVRIFLLPRIQCLRVKVVLEKINACKM